MLWVVVGVVVGPTTTPASIKDRPPPPHSSPSFACRAVIGADGAGGGVGADGADGGSVQMVLAVGRCGRSGPAVRVSSATVPSVHNRQA